MLKNFPKKRPPLPEEIQCIYEKHYKINREGSTPATSIAQKMEAWMHRQVARDINHALEPEGISTLEIGAGTLNQLQYEPEGCPYDIIEPFTELYKGSTYLGRIQNIYSDISDISSSSRYDRITSIATFEHICNLPNIVAKSGRLLHKKGELRVAIPSEGTIMWYLGWRLTTGIEFRLKYGFDYGLLMRHEHVNTAVEIEQILRYFFNKVESKSFGLAKALSFYQFYVCSDPKIEECEEVSE